LERNPGVFKECCNDRCALAMNKYAFTWTVEPASPAEYSLAVVPFEIVVREKSLTLVASADAAEEQKLASEADRVAHDLAKVLSYEHGERFEVVRAGYSYRMLGSAQGGSIVVHSEPPACGASAVGPEVVIRDSIGRIVGGTAIEREQKRQATQQRLADLTKRAALDSNLRDMLDHWHRYVGDPDERLHPLYDLLQVVERRYALPKPARERNSSKVRANAAKQLKMDANDLENLGEITNKVELLNGRHPGASQGPHRTATEVEVDTCERVARSIIENYAAKIVI